MKKENKLLSAEELLGYFDQEGDKGDFIFDINEAREERTEEILNKIKK